MSAQIAVRLPENLVEELDRAVRQGKAKSRTELELDSCERLASRSSTRRGQYSH